MMVQAIGSGFTLLHVLFDVVETIKKQVSMPVQLSISLRAPLDYPHHLCYNRLAISHDASLPITLYHHCCSVDGMGGTGGVAGENST